MKKTTLPSSAALIATSLLWLVSAPSQGCDACNVTFGRQLETTRADSLIGRDFAQAVAKQGHSLQGSGLGSEAFTPQTQKSLEDCAECATLAESEVEVPILLASNTKIASAPTDVEKSDSAPSPPAFKVRAINTNPPMAASPPVSGSRFGASHGQPYDSVPEEWKDSEFIEIIERDYALPFPATSFVPQDTVPDKTFTLELSEGKAYIGNGVVYDGFLTDGTVPGPLIVVDEGDIVEVIIKNTGTIPHGGSIHSAYTQTSKYLGKIGARESGRVVFRCTMPGVYMYHCAPGGHAIPMHVLFGQYGMMVVNPKKDQYEMEKIMGHPPDIEIYLLQHELYSSGKDAVEGLAAYTTFNGKLFRYVEDPIKARPGDYVRIYFLNVGPNLISTFQIVGIIWDYVYWQGNPAVVWPGGQSVLAGPADSWVIEFRIPPDEGAYTMLTHAVGGASRGAIGLIVAEKDAERTARVTPEGLSHTETEMAEIEGKAVRTISPFKPTNSDLPARFSPGTQEVNVSIIGNSFYPKIIEIEPGTTVTWTNEDVFTYLAGEFAGIHNAMSLGADEENSFTTPLLAHGESASHTFQNEGEIDYLCVPHPYMKGRIVVKKSELDLKALAGAGGVGSGLVMPIALGALLIALAGFFRSRS